MLFTLKVVLSQQYKTDSLELVLKQNIADTSRVKVLNNLGHSYLRKGSLKLALNYAQEGLKLGEKIDFKLGIAGAYNTLGNIYGEMSDYPKALESFQNSIEICKQINNKLKLAASYNNIGIIYYNLSDFNKAIEYIQMSLKIQEEMGNKYFVAASIGNIAVLYEKLGEDSLSYVYQLKSLEIHKEMGNKHDMVASLNNLGSLFRKKRDFQKALEYHRQSLEILNTLDEYKGKLENQSNFGLVYLEMGKYDKAIFEFQEALKIARELGDKKSITEVLSLLGKAYLSAGKLNEAMIYFKEAHDISIEIMSLVDQQISADGMYKIYKQRNDISKALYYHELLTKLNDSIFNVSKNTAFNNLKTQFALDRQEHELKSKSEGELKKKEEEKKKQRLIIYIAVAVLGIVVVFSYFLYQRFRITDAQKIIIERQKIEVEEKNKEVTDSIHYAKRIQQALLAHDDFLEQNLPEHFVIYKPKDIVSGDFYWAARENGCFYLALCDCTGHGVPGAFMSLLNISFLNEAIMEKKLREPNHILNHVRNRLIESISSDGAKDGMDCCLMVFNHEKNELLYSSAQNKSVLVRNGELVELKYDKMPVGLGENKNDFTLHTIQLQKGDVFYFYTDGFADQFGGPKGKKYKYKQLNEQFMLNYLKPMKDQKHNLEDEFDRWKGNLEQVDDVCIIGIRI